MSVDAQQKAVAAKDRTPTTKMRRGIEATDRNSGLRHPGDCTNLTQTLRECDPLLAPIIAPVKLSQGCCRKNEIRIRRMRCKEVYRALHGTGQANIQPFSAPIVTPEQPPFRAGRSVSVGQEHHVTSIG